jgi:ABC-type transport system substrate-binding protein
LFGQGRIEPNGQWLPPGVFSYKPDVSVPRFDPENARRLLAKAGYPQGFRLTLHSPSERYPNDARVAQAVAQMWTRIGVQTVVEASPFVSFATRSAWQEFAIRLGAWGSSTGEGAYFLTDVLGTFSRELRRGASNVGRYSNPSLDDLASRAAATIDESAREALFRQAVQIVAEEVPTILLMNLTNSWASRREFATTPGWTSARSQWAWRQISLASPMPCRDPRCRHLMISRLCRQPGSCRGSAPLKPRLWPQHVRQARWNAQDDPHGHGYRSRLNIEELSWYLSDDEGAMDALRADY